MAASDFVQLGYSLATRATETELLPTAGAPGVAVIVAQPFEQGDLFPAGARARRSRLGAGIRLREQSAATAACRAHSETRSPPTGSSFRTSFQYTRNSRKSP